MYYWTVLSMDCVECGLRTVLNELFFVNMSPKKVKVIQKPAVVCPIFEDRIVDA